jgi:crotonobetainyl-CoA:carnitine CoA-transferase CaiB-like acyl-CoA transferase
LPIRIGYSIADQLSAHFASASIVAALINRDKSHKGQIVDVAMADAIAWLTQLDWNEISSTNKTFQLQAKDGWVISNQNIEGNFDNLDRHELTQYLNSLNIEATPVLEINEVINQQSLVDRNFKYQIKMQNSEMADLISPPLGVPVFEPNDFFTLGMHNYLIENL